MNIFWNLIPVNLIEVCSCCSEQGTSRNWLYRIFLITLISTLHFQVPPESLAQSLPINSFQDEQIRIEQLFRGSSLSLLTSRPLHQDLYLKIMQPASGDYGVWSHPFEADYYTIPELPGLKLGLYAPEISAAHNSSLPYGWNNESSWYGRGLNARLSAGFWLSSPYVSVSFRPQFSSQQNLGFEYPRFLNVDDEGYWYGAEAISGQIDRPFRFGNRSFQEYSHGYTSLRLHYRQAEMGVGTEPLWWGPGVHYPLLMSNNAPGMLHFFTGTRSPVTLPYVGRMEFRLIGAFPQPSDYLENVPEEEIERMEASSFQLTKDRFMSGINITFSPSFAPNLSLGWGRVIHTYLDKDGLKASDLGMLLDPIFLEQFLETRGPADQLKPRNHLTSLFFRWVWPESRFELYGEFLRNDFSWDSRDALMETRHNSAYAFGFQKLLLAPGAHFYRVNLEFTNLTPSFIQEVRPQNYFYAHPVIREGHTNRGQLLGAAIGPGSNSQFLSIDSYQEWGRFGFFGRRLADNNHFHFLFDRSLNRSEVFRQGYGDYWRHRTDLTLGVRALYSNSSFVLTSELSWTKLFNYGRFDYGRFGGLNIANFEPYDRTNIHVAIGLKYLFNSP